MVDYGLDGKVAIVTGAAGSGAGGTGFAIAAKLAQQGAKVVMADIDPAGRRQSDELNAQGFDTTFAEFDLAQEETIVALIEGASERYGALDIVVNCGFMQLKEGYVHETDVEAWDRIFAVNMRGDFLMIHHSLPHLLKQGGTPRRPTHAARPASTRSPARWPSSTATGACAATPWCRAPS